MGDNYYKSLSAAWDKERERNSQSKHYKRTFYLQNINNNMSESWRKTVARAPSLAQHSIGRKRQNCNRWQCENATTMRANNEFRFTQLQTHRHTRRETETSHHHCLAIGKSDLSSVVAHVLVHHIIVIIIAVAVSIEQAIADATSDSPSRWAKWSRFLNFPCARSSALSPHAWMCIDIWLQTQCKF